MLRQIEHGTDASVLVFEWRQMVPLNTIWNLPQARYQSQLLAKASPSH